VSGVVCVVTVRGKTDVSPRWRCGIDEKVEVLLTAELSARRVAQTTRKRVRDTQMLSNKTSPGQEACNLALFVFVSDFIATKYFHHQKHSRFCEKGTSYTKPHLRTLP
jgi:hypothetical protein